MIENFADQRRLSGGGLHDRPMSDQASSIQRSVVRPFFSIVWYAKVDYFHCNGVAPEIGEEDAKI